MNRVETFIAMGLILFIACLAIVVCVRAGEDAERHKLLAAYCQSIEYTNYTKLDGLYYCYDGDGLRAIEWASEDK